MNGLAINGSGLTVISKVTGVPVQPLALGVMVTVAVTGELPELVAVKVGIADTPVWLLSPTEAPPAISYTTPAGEPVSGIDAVAPLQ